MQSRSTEISWEKTIVFTEDLKEKLRKPLGRLYLGDVKFDQKFARASPLVVVGDYSYSRFLEIGLRPHVVVVDMRVERRPIGQPNLEGYFLYRVKNPAGTITPEAAAAVVKAVKDGKGAVLVDGEEDLLALPALSALTEKGLLVYGQPGKGYVVVKRSEKILKMIKEIVAAATA